MRGNSIMASIRSKLSSKLGSSWEGSFDACPSLEENAELAQVGTSCGRDPGPSMFPYKPLLNQKISLSNCDLLRLEVDVIVHSTNEKMNGQSSELSTKILEVGGEELQAELAIQAPDGCKTGESIMTKPFNINASRIVHTVGPRYNEKYTTAAENALHTCYLSCMNLLIESQLKTIAIPCIYTKGKGFPRADAAHIAARTIRRFLEHFPDRVEKVVLVISNAEDERIYLQTLPLYFPRSAGEASCARYLLPNENRNEWGGAIIEERNIRVMAMPKALYTTEKCDGSDRKRFAEANDFFEMAGDIDQLRMADLEKHQFSMTKADLDHTKISEVYQAYLEEAENEDLSDIEELRIIYKVGCDSQGRPAFVILMKHLPAHSIDIKRTLLHFILTMDETVDEEYVVILVMSLSTGANHPEMSCLQLLNFIFDDKYRKNMKKLYVVHPSVWFRMAMWFISPMLSGSFSRKICYVNCLKDLYRHFNAKEFLLPEYVYRCDRKLNPESYTP